MLGWPPWRRWLRVEGAQRRCPVARVCEVQPVGAGLVLGAAKLVALAPGAAGLAAAVTAGLAAVGAVVREVAAGGSQIAGEVPVPQHCER